jgi:HK97 family phage major capsid protein
MTTLEELKKKRLELAEQGAAVMASLESDEKGNKKATNDDLEKLEKMRKEAEEVGEQIAALEFGISMKKGADGSFSWQQDPPTVQFLREELQGMKDSQKTPQQFLVKHMMENNWGSRGSGNYKVELEDKGILDLIQSKANMTTTAGFAPEVLRDGTVYGAIARPPQIMDVLAWSETTQNAISYMSQTTRTNAAAERSEAAAFAEATIVYTNVTAPIQSVGVNLPVTYEQLEDAGEVAGLLNIDLVEMVRQRIDQQLVVGDGSAPNIRGIDNTASIQTQAQGAETVIDSIATCFSLIMTGARGNANLVVATTADMWSIVKLRDTQGRYLLSDPGQAPRPMVWGVPIIPHDSLTSKRVLILDTAYWRPVWRKGVTFSRGEINDQYIKNLLTLKADARIGMKAPRPQACVRLTLA